ncbi:tripartite tricarboxylate transporter substrate binding protein [Paracoccus sp. R12_1]|uniref:Bug family tripartite tricarboxylate transporter substrate binding protein n=1 Tax=unclassified Paracoccus (in: a-proteobacteria) TaxID=2688777 RepID=UPI001ADB6317|nr:MULTISPECIES: tripartite tricarboxylate transporter substrate binding protein [unclassified Paracoccus (in: a-proteobacteria)]MBO9456013.1 tripartite tricarboxylate transporter substrate binding protein [Paracoccus sp. R12_2]MBO9486571.1 tripartite tricarboxylate transporter substrate binding protein [Paracoccus sp. R12_1]
MAAIDRRNLLVASALAGACALLPALVAAQQAEWPTQPVHVYVGFPAGSSPDVLARLVTEPLAERLGQPVVVENKPGAGGVIGVQQMLAGEPGHSFGTTINGPLTTSPRLVADISYDVQNDIAPVALMATAPLVLAMAADAGPADLAGFIEAAKADPGGIAYGSVGQGSGAHLTAELFADAAGIEMLHIPFTSYAEVTTSIIGREIDAGFMAPSAALPQVEADKMKMLGVTSQQPFAQVPDVPVIAANAGMPDDFRAELWNAFIAPAGTDPAIIDRLNTAINEILQDPDVQERMLAMGWKAEGGAPADLAQRITDDTQVWGAVIDRIEAAQ